jgi:hypothetical protein
MRFRLTREAPDRSAAGASPVVGDGGENRRHVRRIAVKLAATAAVLALCGLLASAATWSNINSTASNPTNSFAIGTVTIASNAGSSAVLSLTNAQPGAVTTGCIKVTYSGTLPATVKLYGTGGGSGLNQYLTLVVTRGTFSGTPGPGDCTGFTADTTNYISQGAGVMYSGTLANWPATAAAALGDPTGSSPETWTTGETHGYQFQVTLANNPAAQGLTGTETFTFEADNT